VHKIFNVRETAVKDTVLSVGIDIGTTTTQLVFSRITVDNTAALVCAPRVSIVGKEVVYTSDIHLTPLRSGSAIDGERVRLLIESEYAGAGIRPADVRTGAVIITGEAARKENAAEVLRMLAHLAGEFVVATAGPALEGIIAGKGAGADVFSRQRGAVVANLDIGGGTTNIAVFRNGEVIDTACLDIGGRLIRVADQGGRISYISKKMQKLLAAMGLAITEGDILTEEHAAKVARKMTSVLEEVLGLMPPSADLDLLLTDHKLNRDYAIDFLTFSGGVADCMDGGSDSDDYAFGDIGMPLGRAIAQSQILRLKSRLTSVETIRATVVGAGSHTTIISGSTITISGTSLPLQNIPVLKLSLQDEALPFVEWVGVIRSKVDWLRLENGKQPLALAFRGPADISFNELQVLADSIIGGLTSGADANVPLIVIVEKDLAKALGQTLRVKLAGKRDVVCIDTVKVENGDYIDIGRELAGGKVVPVIVKTLLFNY
jgi:ethanolamine utilization protein EutA